MIVNRFRRVFLRLFLCGVIVFSAGSFAAEFPHSCAVSGLRYSEGSVVLFSQHTAKPRLYVIHNISHYPIWLTHEKKVPSASAGWASQLLANHWSAILVTKPNFALQCRLQKKSGGMTTVPCKQVIRTCQFSEFDSKNPISGGYWVVENVLLGALEPRINARGFSLPAEAKIKTAH